MSTETDKILVTVQLPADVVRILDAEGAPEGLKRAAVVRRALLRHIRSKSVLSELTQEVPHADGRS